MTHSPLVSIGLPVRNGEPLLAQALAALLSQDFEDFELLISDNASTDATAAICQAMVASDSRIRYERTACDIGAQKNFDRVLAKATGEFFMWAAHDDLWETSYISSCLSALRRQPAATLAASNILQLHPDGSQSVHTFSPDVTDPDPRVRLRWIWRGGGWGAIYGLIRRRALEQTRAVSEVQSVPSRGLGPDYRLVELALLGPFALVSEPLFVYRLRAREELVDQAKLSQRLDPMTPFVTGQTMFWWLLRDLWVLSGRQHIPLATRLGLQWEYLCSAACPGTLHDVMLAQHTGSLKAALQARHCAKILSLLFERLLLGPWIKP